MSNTHGIDNDDPQLFRFDSYDEPDLLNVPPMTPVPAQASLRVNNFTPQRPSHDGPPTSEEASTMGDAEIVGKGKGVTRTLPIPVPVAAAYDSYENSASTSRGSRQSSNLILTPLTSPQFNCYSLYYDTQQQFDFLSVHDDDGDPNGETWGESKGKQKEFPPVLPPLSFSPTELSSPSLSPPLPASSIGPSSYGSSLLSLSRVASDPSSQGGHASSSPPTHEVPPLTQPAPRPRSFSSISVKSNRFTASRSMSQLRSRLSSSRTSNTLARKLLPKKPNEVDPGLITSQTKQDETGINLDSFAELWRTSRKLDELCAPVSRLSNLQLKDNIYSHITLKHKGRSQSSPFPLSALDIVPLSTPDVFIPIPLIVNNYFDEALPRELRLHVLRSLVELHEADHLRAIRQGRWNVSKASSSRCRWVGRDKGVREIVKFSRVSKSWRALAFDGQLWASLDLRSFPNMSESSILNFTSAGGQCIRSIDISGNSRLTTAILIDMTDHFCAKSTSVIDFLGYTQLTDINLQGCSALATPSLNYLLFHSPSLQKICLKGLKAVTNATCTIMSTSSPQLVSLNVSRCINMDAEGIRSIAKAVLRRGDHLRLKELRMSGLKNITDDMMAVLGKATPCLEVLDLSYARQLHNSAVDAFVACEMDDDAKDTVLVSPRDLGRTDSSEYRIRRRVTRLRHLSLSYCILLTDDACSNLTSSVPNLQFLELGGIGPDMRDDGLIRLLGTTPYIRRLDLEDAANITDSVIFALTPDIGAVPRGSLLLAEPGPGPESEVEPEPGHALEQLNLSFATNVSNEALTGLIRACPRLQRLELDNTHVNSAVVKEFVRTCHRRGVANARVNVVDCRGVSESTVKDLAGLTRPRMGWRAYEARKLGFLDARDGNADEMKVGQDECDEMRVVLKSFSSWQTVDNVRSVREKRRKARRGPAAGLGESGDSEGDEGGAVRSLRWWSPGGGGRRSPRSSGRNSPLNIADLNSDGSMTLEQVDV
ncbi:hypothetical protein H0H92_004473 [Tricholoma furcatifolium]|nr:hypothetical protein H0H92_004473 [Tricholoma furcatifolium]